LDDVDFTILAATSVLRDLMEKCPPAEACRDAFERMSKATVQMCMSTTGFGLDLSTGRPHTRSDATSRPSFTSVSEETSYPNLGVSQSQGPRQEMRDKSRRPPPKFDMNLRDLFPDDINQDDLTSQSYVRQYHPQFVPQPNQPVPVQTQHPSRQYSFPQHQQQVLNSQINAGLGINAGQPSAGSTSQYPHQQQQQQQQQQETARQMQGNPSETSDFYNTTGPYGMDLTNAPELDFLQSTDLNQNTDTTGIDLGFGLGMDFQHDWSDGTGVDIFDGFFFGNAG
jgi:hypothetical protein